MMIQLALCMPTISYIVMRNTVCENISWSHCYTQCSSWLSVCKTGDIKCDDTMDSLCTYDKLLHPI